MKANKFIIKRLYFRLSKIARKVLLQEILHARTFNTIPWRNQVFNKLDNIEILIGTTFRFAYGIRSETMFRYLYNKLSSEEFSNENELIFIFSKFLEQVYRDHDVFLKSGKMIQYKEDQLKEMLVSFKKEYDTMFV